MASTLTVDNIVGATTAANVKLPAGSILQTITSFSHGAAITTASTSHVASGVIASITPKYNNSIILLSFSASFTTLNGNGTGGSGFKFYKSVGGGAYGVVTSMTGTAQSLGFLEYTSNASNYNHSIGTMMVSDSPATTSAINYQLYLARLGSSNSASLQRDWGGAHFHLMEISV